MKVRLLIGALVSLASTSQFTACSDEAEGTQGSLEIAMPSGLYTLVQGDSGDRDITITRKDYSGPIQLTVSDAPINVGISLIDTSTVGGVTTGKIRVVVDSSVSACIQGVCGSRTYLATVRVTGENVAPAERPITIVVKSIPYITLTVPQEHFALTPGGIAKWLDFAISRVNFVDTVRYTLEGAPLGVIGTFSPEATVGDSTNSDSVRVTVQAGENAPPGTYTLTIRASGNGILDRTGSFLLTVKEYPAISLAADDLTVQAGDTGETTVTITRANFVDPVEFSADSLPDGVTASFDPQSTTGDSTTLTLTVDASVAPGVYTIIVRGVEVVPASGSSIKRSAANPVTSSTTFELTVTAP